MSTFFSAATNNTSALGLRRTASLIAMTRPFSRGISDRCARRLSPLQRMKQRSPIHSCGITQDSWTVVTVILASQSRQNGNEQQPRRLSSLRPTWRSTRDATFHRSHRVVPGIVA